MACRPTAIPVDIENTEHLLFVKKEAGGAVSYGGWNKELLVEEIATISEEKLLLCTLCKGMLRDACVVTINQKKEARCDVCVPREYTADARKKAELVRSVIEEKQVYCPMLSEDCKWTGPTIGINSHLKYCQYLPVPCPLCCTDQNILHSKVIQKIQRKLLTNHLNTSCPMRLIHCEYCRAKIRASNFNAHLSICDEYPIRCPNQCTILSTEGSKIFTASRNVIQEHLKLNCPLHQVQCPYSVHGCTDVVLRKNLKTHLMSYQRHLHFVEICLKDTKVKLQNQIADNSKKKQNKSLELSGIEWRLNFFENRKKRKRTFTSSPFYSSGYKLRFITEFNNENCIGAYIQLLQGEYDDGLAWPFSCKVTFILVSENNYSSNFEHSFNTIDTDLHEYFTKPTAHELNPKVGFPKFISHEAVLKFGYCTNDSLLVRVLTQIL